MPTGHASAFDETILLNERIKNLSEAEHHLQSIIEIIRKVRALGKIDRPSLVATNIREGTGTASTLASAANAA